MVGQEPGWAAVSQPSYPPPHTSHGESVTVTKSLKETVDQANEIEEPTRLENGRWACNHKCKDKSM